MDNINKKKITHSLRTEMKKYNITGFMFARGSGSSFDGHERRVLWNICGKSLLEWGLEAGLKSKYINKVVLTTEDKKIMEVGEGLGVTVIPRFLANTVNVPRDWNTGVFQRQRPRSLRSAGPVNEIVGLDPRRSNIFEDPYAYCEWYLEEREGYISDIEVHLAGNEPLGTSESLDRLIEAFFLDEEANIAWTFYPIMPYIFTINPVTKRPFPIIHKNGLDRQCYQPIYRRGPFQIKGLPSKTTYDGGLKIAYIIVPPEEGLDLHDEEDLFLARHYMERRLSKQNAKKEVEAGRAGSEGPENKGGKEC